MQAIYTYIDAQYMGAWNESVHNHHVVYDCSFVSEHIETLEEIDVEYRELALESGIKNWGRVPALGCEEDFIKDLADAVVEALPYVGAMAVSNIEARQVWLI